MIRWLVVLVLLAISPTGSGAMAGISFTKGLLAGTDLDQPTSLQFGPDQRLYVAQLDGLIRVYTVERNGAGDYSVTATETIDLVRTIPNHDDDGTPNPLVAARQITGLLLTGEPANPVLYVSSSDPRIGAGVSGGDTNLDTNSGVLSRLRWDGSAWTKLDLVHGLPRSEENHGPNGMQLDPTTQVLYLTVGGNTNLGAPSDNFALLAEYALSAAVLAIDLAVIGETTHVLPTLDDEDRPGHPDPHDPWGGNNGKNQAMLVAQGPVQIHSPGWRNPYDLVITQAGRMYTIDNGSNGGWGDVPVGEGPGGTCTNEVNEPGVTHVDGLHRISGPGYYGGHPNPTRANPANTFNPANPQTPVPSGNPVECDFLAVEGENGALATFSFSTNGLTEYTASNLGGALTGDLLAAGFGDTIERIRLSEDGTAVEQVEILFSNVGTTPLDVTAQDDGGIFAGSIWVADYGADEIVVFEPGDASSCSGAYDSQLDEDGDGFDNADEIDNGTDPCSPADVPSDNDGDGESDLNDPDDDNDGLLDTADPFAVDADNGATTGLPVSLTWDNDAGSSGGLLNLGWTGLMSNGAEDYEALFDPAGMTAGGAAGVLSVDLVPEGDATGSLNTQQYGFQLGIDVGPAGSPFTVHTRILSPFAGLAPEDSQSMGLFLGTGDQDRYIKLALVANAGLGGVSSGAEIAGAYTEHASHDLTLPGPDHVDLYLAVDPAAGTVQPSYEAVPAGRTLLGGTVPLPASWLTGGTRLAVGILSTSAGPGPEFPASWDFFQVTADPPPSTAEATVEITPNGDLSASTFQPSSFSVANDSADGQRITRLTLDLRTALLPDLVYDPDGAAGDGAAKCFEADFGSTTVGLVAPADPCADPFSSAHDLGYDLLTIEFTDFDPGESFSFSVDVDPTSIQGGMPPGPNDSGSVSGLELTGSTVLLDYDDGTQLTAASFRIPGSDGGSRATAASILPPAAWLEILGIPVTPTTVGLADQTARISGPPGSAFSLLVVEAGLFTEGLPGGGFDLDPFEANSAVFVDEHVGTLGPSGIGDVPLSLTAFGPDGLNYLVAVLRDAEERTGPTSPVVVLQLAPCVTGEDCNDGNACTEDSCVSVSCLNDPVADGTACDDDDVCTQTDECSAGICTGILIDTDSDGQGDPCDDDDDDDGVADGQDCAPVTAGVSAPPGPIGPTLRLARTSVVSLAWSRAEQGHTSNLYRGEIPAAYDPACMLSELPATTAADSLPTQPGMLVYYLVAARNTCGEGSAGQDSEGQARTGWSPCPSVGADTDGDGVADPSDNCPLAPDAGQSDADLDYVGDACDNCPANPNPDQADGDGDDAGDVCDVCPDDATDNCAGDPDQDQDGLIGAGDPCPSDPRNLCFAPVAVDGLTGNPIRVNANVSGASCSGDKIDCSGQAWYADFGYSDAFGAATCDLNGGGSSCIISGLTELFDCEDSATEDLFQCEHWDSGADPPLAYTFDVPDGEYVVNLFFANTFSGTTSEGSRIFDISIEDQLVYDDFDQVASAGGSGIAVVRSARVTVADADGLRIEFGHVLENPAVKAIEVLGPAP